MLNGQWNDLIVDFMDYTESALTPDIHRKWAAISMIAGALERRVWAKTGDYIVFPNLYVLLVAPPGTGKYIIEDIRDLWEMTKEPSGGFAYHVASDSVTRASLIDELSKAKCTRLLPNGPPFIYHSLLIASEEFEILLPSYDSPFISLLNGLWNNKQEHRETRRHGPAREVKIPKPQLNILAGVQPAYFTAHFPEEAWQTGLIRRIIMVYADATPLKDIFSETPDKSVRRQAILDRLSAASAMYGQATWSPDAADHLRTWHMTGRHPEPSHSKLVNYRTSRTQFVSKLSLISCVARTADTKIELIDVNRAMQWLFEAEEKMPDIFRAMLGKSDSQVIEELHYFVMNNWTKSGRKTIPTSMMAYFLQTRLPADRIMRVIEIAERANMIARVAGTSDQWIPRPKHQHGTE